jgi:hypothetical protein
MVEFTDRMLRQISLLNSFVRANDDSISFAKKILPEDASLIGAYVNDFDSFILISSVGLHWVKQDKLRDIPFDFISNVQISDASPEPQLDLTLRDGSSVSLPILHETEEELDVYVMRDFLRAIIFWPHYNASDLKVVDVRSRDDLVDLLQEQHGQAEGWRTHYDIVEALDSGFPQPWQLQASNIEPQILSRPDVWRFLALFLCVGTETWDQRQDRERKNQRRLFEVD